MCSSDLVWRLQLRQLIVRQELTEHILRPVLVALAVTLVAIAVGHISGNKLVAPVMVELGPIVAAQGAKCLVATGQVTTNLRVLEVPLAEQ